MADTLFEIVLQHQRPDQAAIIEIDEVGSTRLRTFSELAHEIDSFAAAVAAYGLTPGARIAIASENRIEAVTAFLGAQKADMIPCPLNVRLAETQIEETIEDAGVEALLCESGFQTLAPSLPRLSLDQPPPQARFETRTMPQNLATLMFTSGSTGRAKGVPITHAGYTWALKQFMSLSETMAGERALVAAPLFHMNAQFHTLSLLSSGASIVLMKRFDPRAFLTIARDYRIKRLTGVPTMFALAARVADQADIAPLDHVAQVALGSSPLSRPLWEKLSALFPNALITNGYGTTETGPCSFGPHPSGLPTPPTALGYPMAGVETRLTGAGAPNEGVLQMRTPMTLRSYWNRPDADAARITKDGWYDTGDVMRRDEHGFHYFVGRADDMMQVGGENVYPASVERILEQHPAVREAAVVPVPHETKGEAPVAFVTLRAPLDEAELKAHALANGPAYAHPRRIFFLESLPLTGANKIDRQALKADARGRLGDVGALSPSERE